MAGVPQALITGCAAPNSCSMLLLSSLQDRLCTLQLKLLARGVKRPTFYWAPGLINATWWLCATRAVSPPGASLAAFAS